jgi:hypothetical protein
MEDLSLMMLFVGEISDCCGEDAAADVRCAM